MEVGTSRQQLARCIDHTLLRPDASRDDIIQLCREALDHQFWSVCVHGCRVAEAYDQLMESSVHVAAVVGFPHGAGTSDAKRFETEAAVDDGAHEIDVVMNVGLLKEGAHSAVLRELRDVAEAAEERTVKVILETGYLSADQKILACKLVLDSGAKFVKTSTGFGPGGATVEDVRLLRESVGPAFGVKASGGIRNLRQALAMIDAGASRLGTSAGVAILKELRNSPPPSAEAN